MTVGACYQADVFVRKLVGTAVASRAVGLSPTSVISHVLPLVSNF
jgi:hypothetical protein